MTVPVFKFPKLFFEKNSSLYLTMFENPRNVLVISDDLTLTSAELAVASRFAARVDGENIDVTAVTTTEANAGKIKSYFDMVIAIGDEDAQAAAKAYKEGAERAVVFIAIPTAPQGSEVYADVVLADVAFSQDFPAAVTAENAKVSLAKAEAVLKSENLNDFVEGVAYDAKRALENHMDAATVLDKEHVLNASILANIAYANTIA
ncbi:MAG: hypothetical protein LBN08_05120 [Lactobacillales bacterium]|jgi:alcohol dehydrogenase class IV|nr:hypothetical protein [Lactobacillales bacterium]